MKNSLICLGLIFCVPIANTYSIDKLEIEKFCKKTKNYSQCMIEFQGVQGTNQNQGMSKAIEIKVIPWKY